MGICNQVLIWYALKSIGIKKVPITSSYDEKLLTDLFDNDVTLLFGHAGLALMSCEPITINLKT